MKKNFDIVYQHVKFIYVTHQYNIIMNLTSIHFIDFFILLPKYLIPAGQKKH